MHTAFYEVSRVAQCCTTLQTAFYDVSRVAQCCTTLQTAFYDVSRVARRCKQHFMMFPVSRSVARRCKQHFMMFPVSRSAAARRAQHFMMFPVHKRSLQHFSHAQKGFAARIMNENPPVYWAWVRKGDQKTPKRNSISTAAAEWTDIAPHAGTALGVPSCGHIKYRSMGARGREMYSQGCNFALF